MSYMTGHQRRIVIATNRIDFGVMCGAAVKDEFELYKASARIDWPFFWRKVYTAQFRKYYIIDDSKIAYFSKREIDRIKTGK